jgi:type IV pilus assembly protein PilB
MALSVSIYKEIFVEKNGLLKKDAFDKVVELSEKTKRPLDQLLMERSFITAPQLLELEQGYFKVPGTMLKVDEIDVEVLHTIPEEFANKNLVVAFSKEGSNINVAFENPNDQALLEELQSIADLTIKPYVAIKHSLQQALILYKGDFQTRIKESALKFEQIGSNSTITTNSATDLLDAIIEAAILTDASDIHIEPYETEIVIRFRVDGQLRTIVSLPQEAKTPLIARIKILSELKVDQKRLPQDGRFGLVIEGQEINFRVSTVPSLWGEKAVMRVLPKEAHLFDIASIGLIESDVSIVKDYLSRPHGMILVTGPTGSGKTTTLYSFLQDIGNDRIDVVNISTIEDPIEYTIPRVTQIQTQPEIDLTFANGLRALLRQDPDILMVGEIRDEETADFAVRAALVGRLLISSLHTNDAPTAVPRLLDMGIEPYLLSSVLMLVVAQRLARKLCTYCRQSYHPEKGIVDELNKSHNFKESIKRLHKKGVLSDSGTDNLRFFKADGCDRCDHTGYKGRIGVFEILEVTPELQAAISSRTDSNAIREIAIEGGMKTMFEDGIAKLLVGDIDLDELLRAVYS